MATIDTLAGIARALNRVETAGQTRAAIGAALNALGNAYKLLADLNSTIAESSRRELDTARMALEEWYRRIESVPTATPYKGELAKHRKLIERAYVIVAGVEGAANWVPRTQWVDVLEEIVRETGSKIGEVAGKAARAAGEAAGAAAGGAVSGLGWKGVAMLAGALIVVLFVLKRGTLLGRLLP